MKKNSKPDGFDTASRTAQEYIEDKDKAEHLLSAAIAKAERHQTTLKNIWEDLQALFRLMKVWIRGDYAIPWQTLLFVIAAIVYFVNPFDIVPDFIPGSGYLDDATVIGFVLKSIKRDIVLFLQWEDARISSSEKTDPE